MILLFESKADQLKLVNFAGQELADEFFKLKQRMSSPYNDIYYWLKRTPEELKEYVNNILETQTQSEKRNSAKEGAKLIANENGWKVYEILTYPASVYYGKNTQWCISGSKRWSNGERGEEYFDKYTMEWGVRFFFFIKNNNEKYAVALYPSGTTEIFNSVDDEIDNLPSDCPHIEELSESYDNNEYASTETTNDTLIYNDSTKINDYVRNNITFVAVSDDVTEVPEEEFRDCKSLKRVVFGENVEDIGSFSFYNCNRLNKIDFSKCKKLSYIGENAFSKSSILSVKLPDTLNYVDRFAFRECKSLQYAKLPSDILVIEDGLFDGCYALDDVTIPSRIKRVGKYAFSETSISEIELPNTVESLGRFAFYKTKLNSITIPDSVKYINRKCFADCESLTDVTIPKIQKSKELYIYETAFVGSPAEETVMQEIKDNIFITIEEDEYEW